MPYIFFTLDIFQFDISGNDFNDSQKPNRFSILVIFEISGTSINDLHS